VEAEPADVTRHILLGLLVILASAADPARAQRPADDPYALYISAPFKRIPFNDLHRIPFNYIRLYSAAETLLRLKEPVRTPANVPAEYRIGPEDVLQIALWKNEALSRRVPVRPDGKISLPLLNDVQAAGLTAIELRDVLTERLKEFIPSPEVSVIVSDVRSLKISVIGEPTLPGRYGRYELPMVPPGHRFVVLVPGEHGSIRRIGSYSREELQSILDRCRTPSEEVCHTFKNAIILVP
jgi:polysaccharide biosynthesis/export protein